MKFKSINRFFILGTALLAVLIFFGARSNDHSVTKNYFASFIQKQESLTPISPLPPPVEIENKEEQPQTEDDEVHCDGGLDSSLDVLVCHDLQLFFEPSVNGVLISKSQTEYHTPAYVRLRSMLI